jgi:AcrR family transcriptional regulator
MGRPRQHDASTGIRLLDVAEKLLATGGEDAVTVRSVAEAADTSTRAVYAVFGSKEALLAALATRGYGILEDLVAALPETDDPVADLVAAGTSCFRTFAIERPHLFRLTFERVTATMLANPSAGPALMSSYRALRHRITAARIAAGHEIPDDTVAFGFHSLCVGLANSELARRPPPEGAGFWGPVRGIDGEDLWRTALGAYVRGLT